MRDVVKVRLAAVVMVLGLVGAVALTAAFYQRAFADLEQVRVATARSGLIMDPGNQVKYRGVEVGRVAEVNRDGDDRAELVLDIDADQLERIGAGVSAEIRASTIFGAKFVELLDPAGAQPVTAGTALRAGAVIDAVGTTREVNTLFESVDDVVSNVDVVGLNTTLSVLSTTLDGRGDQIAALAAQADRYLTQLEPELPQLRLALRELAELSVLGAETAPEVLAILDNATTTSRTIAEEDRNLDRLLVDLNLLGQTGSTVLGDNTEPLGRALARVRPTSALLAEYSSQLRCFLVAIDQNSSLLTNVVGGGRNPGIDVISTLRPAVVPFPVGDVPRAYAGKGPKCGALPGPIEAGDIPVEGLVE